MINYRTDPNGTLYAEVMNKTTNEKFMVCNNINPYNQLWQQAVLDEENRRALVLNPFDPSASTPSMMCETPDRKEAAENVKILAELFEKEPVNKILESYGEKIITQIGSDIWVFDKAKWLNASKKMAMEKYRRKHSRT